MANNRK